MDAVSPRTDWSAWSREAVALMQARNDAWVERFGLSGAPYTWNLHEATIRFQRPMGAVIAELCYVGSVTASEGTFRWAWANDGVPKQAWERLHTVVGFGRANDLDLLTTPEWNAGRADGLEMVAVAGRILDADGTFVDTHRDLTTFFLLFDFKEVPSV